MMKDEWFIEKSLLHNFREVSPLKGLVLDDVEGRSTSKMSTSRARMKQVYHLPSRMSRNKSENKSRHLLTQTEQFGMNGDLEKFIYCKLPIKRIETCCNVPSSIKST